MGTAEWAEGKIMPGKIMILPTMILPEIRLTSFG